MAQTEEKRRATVKKYKQSIKGKEASKRERQKEGYKEARREYCKLNRYKEKKREYYKSKRRELFFKYKYNLSLEQIDELLVKQNHKCLICGRSLIETKRCIDHNHKTGKIRGILCCRCNTGLSFIENKEFLEMAINYLDKMD